MARVTINHDPNPRLTKFVEQVATSGGRVMAVGGAVRDALMNRQSHDLDFEVFGIQPDSLTRLILDCSDPGSLKTTGVRFQVFKARFGGVDVDISLPRVDLGAGRNDFETQFDPFLSFGQAAARRDFTINAILVDMMTGEMIDPFGGVSDILFGILRPVSDKFSDDPLRIVRGVQFAGRFGFRMAGDPESQRRFQDCLTGAGGARLAQLLGTDPMRDEFKKLFLSPFPGEGLRFMFESGLAGRFFPELSVMAVTPQDQRWHPEGDVMEHTIQVMNAAAKIARARGMSDNDTITTVAAAMLHDIGKPSTTVIHDDGSITSPGHAGVGANMCHAILDRMGFIVPGANSHPFAEGVTQLVREHMVSVDHKTDMRRFTRRLAMRVPSIALLSAIVSADVSGRVAPGGIARIFTHDTMIAIDKMAAEMSIETGKPQPIIMGRHLIALGLKHGKGCNFTEILGRCFEAQLDGQFTDEASGREFLIGVLVGMGVEQVLQKPS